MNTRKLFTDPTEEHADCSKAKCDNSKTSDNNADIGECDLHRPSGKAEDYVGEKL
ncbi:MAG: hypothetical protein R3A13_04820 [Bdellovibrionota bacterium]